MSDLSWLKEYVPTANEDTIGFKPFKGKYVCRLDKLERVQGTSEKSGSDYDFWGLSLQVTSVEEGDNALNRYLKANYQNDQDGLKKLANDLFTAGFTFSGNNEDELEQSFALLKDKSLFVAAWTAPKVKKEGSEWVKVEPEVLVQKMKIVKELNLSKKGEGKGEGSAPEKAPLADKIPF